MMCNINSLSLFGYESIHFSFLYLEIYAAKSLEPRILEEHFFLEATHRGEGHTQQDCQGTIT